MYEFPRKVSYYETDAMGVVHHSNFYRYFEDARVAMMEHWGLDFGSDDLKGIVLAVVTSECQYKKPLRFGDRFLVKLQARQLGPARVEFQYLISTATDATTIALGRTIHVPVNGSLAPVRIAASLAKILEKLPWNETLL